VYPVRALNFECLDLERSFWYAGTSEYPVKFVYEGHRLKVRFIHV